MKYYFLLALAIFFEVIGTTALKASSGFQHLFFTFIVIIAYGMSFTFFGFSLKGIGVGIAYAIWCSLGIVSVAIIGIILYGERPNPFSYLGFALIITGVICLTLLSNSET